MEERINQLENNQSLIIENLTSVIKSVSEMTEREIAKNILETESIETNTVLIKSNAERFKKLEDRVLYLEALLEKHLGITIL